MHGRWLKNRGRNRPGPKVRPTLTVSALSALARAPQQLSCEPSRRLPRAPAPARQRAGAGRPHRLLAGAAGVRVGGGACSSAWGCWMLATDRVAVRPDVLLPWKPCRLRAPGAREQRARGVLGSSLCRVGRRAFHSLWEGNCRPSFRVASPVTAGHSSHRPHVAAAKIKKIKHLRPQRGEKNYRGSPCRPNHGVDSRRTSRQTRSEACGRG